MILGLGTHLKSLYVVSRQRPKKKREIVLKNLYRVPFPGTICIFLGHKSVLFSRIY